MLEKADWEAVMKRCSFPAFHVVAADWRQTVLCAQYLTGAGQTLRAGLLLADGEYIHRRNGGSPETFFCRMMRAFLDSLQKPFESLPDVQRDRIGLSGVGGDAGTLFLISVPEAKLPRQRTMAFAACLEQTLEPLVGKAVVIMVPRIRAVWEHSYGYGIAGVCDGMLRHSPGRNGVIQILEDETQFLLEAGEEITIAFGSRLAGNGIPQRYYNAPVRYRENNYLFEMDRFLWQDAEYASWYLAFYQISKRVLAAHRPKNCHYQLTLTGDPDCLFCAEKALADLNAVDVAGSEIPRALDIPAYLLEWYCHMHERTLLPVQNHFVQGREESGNGMDIWTI